MKWKAPENLYQSIIMTLQEAGHTWRHPVTTWMQNSCRVVPEWQQQTVWETSVGKQLCGLSEGPEVLTNCMFVTYQSDSISVHTKLEETQNCSKRPYLQGYVRMSLVLFCLNFTMVLSEILPITYLDRTKSGSLFVVNVLEEWGAHCRQQWLTQSTYLKCTCPCGVRGPFQTTLTWLVGLKPSSCERPLWSSQQNDAIKNTNSEGTWGWMLLQAIKIGSCASSPDYCPWSSVSQFDAFSK